MFLIWNLHHVPDVSLRIFKDGFNPRTVILNILQPTKVVDAKRLCKKEDDGLDEEEEVSVTHKA